MPNNDNGCLPKSVIAPLGMMLASSLNIFGGMAAIGLNPENRGNPFFYTAIATSGIYAFVNAIELVRRMRGLRRVESSTSLIDGVPEAPPPSPRGRAALTSIRIDFQGVSR